ncbi:MAG TPA: hypothetical protein VE687_04845 [Stellaceae bacterium]|nr:hypothetical protein [Stellaceae bacterium]
MPTARDIALRIIEAYRAGVGLAPVRGGVKGVPAAYQVQQAWLAEALTRFGGKLRAGTSS